MRIEAVRSLLPEHLVSREPHGGGPEALGYYHEKRSEDAREIGLGPAHDWSSHGADAFGLMAVFYELPAERPREIKYPQLGLA